MTAEVVWKVVGNKLIRQETLTADKDLTLKNWRFAVPTTAAKNRVEFVQNKRLDVFTGDEGTLKINADADWKYEVSVSAAGDSRLGKGVIRAIPLHLVLTADTLQLKARQPKRWQIEIEVASIN